MTTAAQPPLPRRLLAEFLGTALLVAVVVGSGIAAEQLSPGDVGLQLLENSTATVLGLTVLILLFGPVSGAHFNPVVSLADWLLGRRSGHGLALPDVGAYAVAQVLGAVAGAVLANAMFGVATTVSTTDRATGSPLLAEAVAPTFLVALVFALARTGRAAVAAAAVGAYIGAAYMERMFGIERPSVALLSIGEESTKGNQLVLEAHEELRTSRLNFIGNVEGKDLSRGAADVVVMDGFTGNVVIKTVEGIADLIFTEVRHAVELTPWNRAAGLILYGELRKTKRRLDYAEYGGAQLLGVNGVIVIAHGRSNARAVFNAIRAARDGVQNGVLRVIEEIAREVPAKGRRDGPAGDGRKAD